MPDVKKGESRSSYMKRCIPYYTKRGLTLREAKGKCYGMYKNKHGLEADEYEEFKFEVPMMKIPMKEEFDDDNENIEHKQYSVGNKGQRHAVALVGNRFYKGQFMPAKELKKAYKQWEGTFHDINHFGTTFPVGFFFIPNILYFVGYNNNVKWNNKTNPLITIMYVVSFPIFTFLIYLPQTPRRLNLSNKRQTISLILIYLA